MWVQKEKTRSFLRNFKNHIYIKKSRFELPLKNQLWQQQANIPLWQSLEKQAGAFPSDCTRVPDGRAVHTSENEAPILTLIYVPCLVPSRCLNTGWKWH